MRKIIELTEGQDAIAWLLAQPELEDGCYGFVMRHRQYYLAGEPPIVLQAYIEVEAARAVALCVLPEAAAVKLGAPGSPLGLWCQNAAIACIDLKAPFTLSTVDIPKPWGREVWFTGIEQRGQCGVQDAHGRTLTLPWLLAFLPDWLGTGYPQAITLLKILDPLPEPVFGDLYFEMHEKKQEVYVVTRVDERAWPEGVGGIRFGFNQQKRSEFSSDDAFRKAYLAAVHAYRACRDEIDHKIDILRARDGVALDAAVPAAQTKAWQAELPEALKQQELRLRETLDSFAAVLPLKVGDVVKVPCFTPHSLLHGVTTVEFQTPVYERKILSFAQKVLTQPHWDTEAALEVVNLDAPENTPLPVLPAPAGCSREQVVAFDDFSVERWQLPRRARVELREVVACSGRAGNSANSYVLIMALHEGVSVGGRPIAPGQAALVPAALNDIILACDAPTAEQVTCLISIPGPSQSVAC
ncbi:hypothetical protein L1F30_09695 [Simiduia sp. 21SJ11W-1]|uniref:hypothetical protein n=1 Tax=Simiduia sp. 21SJ11W-1 TaxID=2909669 RepID=UPI0020A14759|nr:hypothetical protein [Simiduia sp. 21SJ11W-1]UTA46446.1 hypothetical protein L1F30_09695 [Simiduia sp. 21SJ11W-1]